jgi:hypothetical protein
MKGKSDCKKMIASQKVDCDWKSKEERVGGIQASVGA